MCMLFIEINTMAVDVNVHPAKLEVKFSNDALVFGAVFRAVANTLAKIREIPENEMIPLPKVSEMPAPEEEKIPSREKRQMDISSVAPEALFPKYPVQPASPAEENVRSPYKSIESETLYFGSESEDADKDGSDNITESKFVPERRENGPSKPYNETEPSEKCPITETERKVLDSPSREPVPKKMPEVEVQTVTQKEEEDTVTVSEEAEEPEKDSPSGALGDYRYYKIIGELYNKYALVEAVTLDGTSKFIMIDKHAAHERMLFEELKRNFRFDMGAQMLMFPTTLNVSSFDAVTAKLHEKKLESFGFKIEADLSTIVLHSIPNGFDEDTAIGIFYEIIELMKEDRAVTDEFLPEKMERALFTVACKAAIKGGRTYPPEFLDTVVRAVLSDPSIRFCPHGRPVAFEMSLSEIDARFKR